MSRPWCAALRRGAPRLMDDAATLVAELGRLTVLHDEEVLAALQDLHTDVMQRAASVREEAARLGADGSALVLAERCAAGAYTRPLLSST